jgi:hypothetical protein
VQEIAMSEGYVELLAFLAVNTGAYARFILIGEEK